MGADPLLSLGIARITVLATGIAWAVGAVSPTVDRWRFAGVVAATGTALHTVLLLAQVARETDRTFIIGFAEREEIRLLGGSLNNAAAVLVVALPFMLILVRRSSGAVRWLGGFAVMLATWGAFLSESRALTWALVFVVAGWGAAALVDWRRTRSVATGLAAGAMLLGAILGTTSIASEVVSWLPELTTAIVADGDGGIEGEEGSEVPTDEEREIRNESSDSHRMLYFKAAWEDFAERPILGLGFRLRERGPERSGFAHNVVLELLASTGVIGLVAYFAVVVVYAVRWWHERRYEIAERLIAGGGLIAGFVIALVQPFLNTGHVFAVLWWLLLALGVGLVFSQPNGGSMTPEAAVGGSGDPEANGGPGSEDA